MSKRWIIRDADPGGVLRLAAYVALFLKPGDVIALSGELGAGKTTFARGVIRAVLDDELHDIPSPTFALVQSYSEGRLPVAHIDCYRIEENAEFQEIGLDDALREGAALIEWAERVVELLPDDRVEITFSDGAGEETRTVAIEGRGASAERVARLKSMMDFCERTAWAEARPRFLQGDASTRAYARLAHKGQNAILMDSPPRPDGEPVRGGKPYSQLVHLVENVRPFVAVGLALESAGLSVPHIYEQDLENGFLITEDLGDRVYSAEAGRDPPLEDLYRAAVDVLVHLASHPPAGKLSIPSGGTHTLPAYDLETMEFEAELLLDWFYPALRNDNPQGSLRDEFVAAMRPLLKPLAGQDDGWVLRDYHSPNLLWLPEREGIRSVGVIDFQDALAGHAAYDLVSLLQDARRDIPADLEDRLFAHYCHARAQMDSAFDPERFRAAYAVLGGQRNCKVLGIFARLAKRDGKGDYLAHIPRVSAYLERDLAHPALAAPRAWFERHLPSDIRNTPLALPV